MADESKAAKENRTAEDNPAAAALECHEFTPSPTSYRIVDMAAFAVLAFEVRR
jgi:hypothetical protein